MLVMAQDPANYITTCAGQSYLHRTLCARICSDEPVQYNDLYNDSLTPDCVCRVVFNGTAGSVLLAAAAKPTAEQADVNESQRTGVTQAAPRHDHGPVHLYELFVCRLIYTYLACFFLAFRTSRITALCLCMLMSYGSAMASGLPQAARV